MIKSRKFFLISTVSIIGISLFPTSHAQDLEIPSWIKNTAEFSINEQMSDQDFINTIQYLIDEKIYADFGISVIDYVQEFIDIIKVVVPYES